MWRPYLRAEPVALDGQEAQSDALDAVAISGAMRPTDEAGDAAVSSGACHDTGGAPDCPNDTLVRY